MTALLRLLIFSLPATTAKMKRVLLLHLICSTPAACTQTNMVEEADTDSIVTIKGAMALVLSEVQQL